MRVTYITPICESSTEYNLLKIYKCLQKQTSGYWLWFIYDDNTIYRPICDYIKNVLCQDKRIIFAEHINEFSEVKGSGPAKYMAFKKAGLYIPYRESEIFCELDHDDLLSLDCTETIIEAFEYKKFDFLHANTIVLKDDFTPNVTGYCDTAEFQHPLFGYKEQGDCVKALVSYENITSKRITMNIRCYNRYFYERIGGFDYKIDYGEDFDILIRVMAQAKTITYINKPLYYYYFNENCSSSKLDCEKYFENIMRKNEGLLNMFKNTVVDVIDYNDFHYNDFRRESQDLLYTIYNNKHIPQPRPFTNSCQ